MNADTVIVLDFETSGLSPGQGDRAIEIGAVRIEGGEVTGRYQKLMNPGFRINGFIESYTGITNHMLRQAPPNAEVMNEFADFIGDHNLVAHNASFDKRFLEAELALIGRKPIGKFACSMLAARRIYPSAPNHKLESLIHYKRIQTDGVFHRALADSRMTALLWLAMIDDLKSEYRLSMVSFSLMCQLAKLPKAKLPSFLQKKAECLGT